MLECPGSSERFSEKQTNVYYLKSWTTVNLNNGRLCQPLPIIFVPKAQFHDNRR